MIEFFFDCSSPWTYLGFHNIQPLAAEAKVALHWRPILVGGVFNAVNPGVYAARDNPVPAKRDYQLKDLQDWARLAGLRIVMPPTVFPVNSVKAMRGCLWADAQGRLVPFATAVFEAYWGRDQDISQDAVLAEVCERCGIAAAASARRRSSWAATTCTSATTGCRCCARRCGGAAERTTGCRWPAAPLRRPA